MGGAQGCVAMTTLHRPILLATLAAASLAAAQASMPADRAERCATRLSIAFTGKSASSALMSSSLPQASVDQLIQTPDFVERFSRFVNSQMNDDPGTNPEDDSAYWLTRYVLQN